MIVYVLLKFYKDHDQHGGYFHGAFDTYADAENMTDHVGRDEWENPWFEIRVHVIGEYVSAMSG